VSKSATSSLTAVPLRMRWSVGSLLLNVPSRLVVWRGPRAKYQVTLSVRPSTWHAPQEPQAAPFSDQRPRPVLNSALPFCTLAAVPVGYADDASSGVCPADSLCVFRLMAMTLRVP